MTEKARKRMKLVTRDCKDSEKIYNSEGERLCDLQHEEYLKFYDVFKKCTPKNEYRVSLQR